MDDRKRLGHAIMKNKTQKRANIDCRCKKGKCRWTSHGKPNLTLSGKKLVTLSHFVKTTFIYSVPMRGKRRVETYSQAN
jgi:hypothetical protein